MVVGKWVVGVDKVVLEPLPLGGIVKVSGRHNVDVVVVDRIHTSTFGAPDHIVVLVAVEVRHREKA